METSYKKHLEKHLGDLPCPICWRPVYFNDKSLRSHLNGFHKRIDVTELIELSMKMCGIIDDSPRLWG